MKKLILLMILFSSCTTISNAKKYHKKDNIPDSLQIYDAFTGMRVFKN